MGYLETYRAWCASDAIDEATRSELRAIEQDPVEIEDRFYRSLEFGTRPGCAASSARAPTA